MNIGLYELDITPPLGSLIPGGFAARFSDDVDDCLFVRAMVADDGERKIALAVIDCCGITHDVVTRIRERVEALAGMQPATVMVMANHIHAGGPTLNWGEEIKQDPVYLDFLVIKTADAIVLADKKKRPLSPKTALGTAPGLGFIRIFRMKDQTLVTNPPFGDPNLGEPYTEGDDDVLVLGFFDGDKPVGAVVNFACHPAIVAKTYTSADFIGALSANLKEIYGPRFVTLFVNGACGNINHINRFDRSTAAPGRHVYIGQQLAEVTVKLLQEAVAVDAEKVGYAVDTVRLGLRRPSEEALLEAKALIDGFGDDFMHQTGKSKQYKDVFFALQTLWRMADKNSFVDAEVQVFDFGGITLFGMPAQMFCEYGKALKEAKGKKAIVSIFANMYLGYCPVPVCMVPGVYEAKLATSSMLQSDSGDKLVKTALELCEKIHTNPVKEAEKVKK